MKSFQFKFEPLLRLRRYRRDLCRQLLASVLDDDARLVSQRRKFEETRRYQLDEMRSLGKTGAVDVSGSASRRYYSGQLLIEMRLVDRQREVVAKQIELCRQALVRADQEVKALEKIEEKQRGKYEYEQEKRSSRELEDSWSAAHSVEALR